MKQFFMNLFSSASQETTGGTIIKNAGDAFRELRDVFLLSNYKKAVPVATAALSLAKKKKKSGKYYDPDLFEKIFDVVDMLERAPSGKYIDD